MPGRTKKTTPKISVLIPTYNRSGTLPRAIDSVLTQSIDDFEIIVVDDGSEDNTEEIVREFDDDRIVYIAHDTNRGQNTARNTGLKAANGDFISYLDSDDDFYPTHLERVSDLLDDLPKKYAGIITGYEDCIGDDCERKHVYEGSFSQEDLIQDMYDLIGGLSIVTFRSDILDDIGYHDEAITKSTDLDFYLEVLDEYLMYGLDELLVRRYKQPDSVSESAQNVINGEAVLLQKWSHVLTGEGRAQRRYNRAQAYMEVGEHRRAFVELAKATKDMTRYYLPF